MSLDITPWLLGGGFAASGIAILVYCVCGARRGRVRPLIRSSREKPYYRRREPKRFWASLIYNGVVGAMVALGGAAVLWAEQQRQRERPFQDACLAEAPGRPPESVVAACDRWLELRPAPFEQGLARSVQADAYALLGDPVTATMLRRAAVAAYGRSLSGYPEDSAAHWNSAFVMLAMGDLPQARQSLQAYVALEPDQGRGWLELGLIELRLDQPRQAIVSLTRAIERLPGEARPLAARGIALAGQKDLAQATLDIEAARRLDPNDPLVKQADRLLPADALIP